MANKKESRDRERTKVVRDQQRSAASSSSEFAGEAAVRRGDLGELEFARKAAELRLNLSLPFGNGAPYDWAVEKNGRFCRVQVKCSKLHRRKPGAKKRKPNYHFSSRSRRLSTALSDIVVCYGEGDDVWVIPTAVVEGRTQFGITPEVDTMYRDYHGRWDILTAFFEPPAPAVPANAVRLMEAA